jgi:DNA transformation protein
MPKQTDSQSDQKKFLDRILKKLSVFGNVTSRFMFGGYGIYFEGSMIALIAYEEIYFKTDKETVELFVKAKQRPFIYDGKSGKPAVMSYYTIPKVSWKSADSLKQWFELSLGAAKRASQKKKSKKHKTNLSISTKVAKQ